ncbi:MAG TPA: hypothetical protein PK583_00355 [Gammaproteobacteria bacterium]|nr:hypothetical protein [Gammaproteobacteria bacterium]
MTMQVIDLSDDLEANTFETSEHHSDKTNFDKTQWEALKNRILEKMASSGITLLQIAIETMPQDDGTRRNYNTVETWKACIEGWIKDSSKFREPGRHWNQEPLAKTIESQLEKWLDAQDNEQNNKFNEPCFVATSVAANIMEKIHKARVMQDLIEIPSPPGHGKTSAIAQYQLQCRKSEGFDAPVWVITLRETNLTLKIVLLEMACAIYASGKFNGDVIEPNEKMEIDLLEKLIERMAIYHRGGVFIFDEANHLGRFIGITRSSGGTIANALRTFIDRKLFGIALLSNGEMLQRARELKSIQITSRITCEKPIKLTENDILLIMQSWGVSGKKELEWCLKMGMGEGGLRTLVKAFKNSLYDIGTINHDSLMFYKKI